MADKQEAALDGLIREIDKLIRRNVRITRVRMNFWTMNRLFAGTINIFYEGKARGTKGWPIGAFGQLDRKFGKDGYFVLDNTLADGEVDIDTAKK